MSGEPDHLDGLTARVAELEARSRIGNVLARYCDRLDAYDIDGVAATFTADAAADYGPGRGGPTTGRDAIAARIRDGQAAFRRTHHQLGHSTVDVDLDAQTADAVTAALTWHERHDGTQELLALRYLDTLTCADGNWLIAARRVEISLVEGFTGTEWHWWPRAAPAHE